MREQTCTCLSISRDPLCVFHGDVDKVRAITGAVDPIPTVPVFDPHDLVNARLAVSDWHACSTAEELARWRAAILRLIVAAKASVYPEVQAAKAERDTRRAQLEEARKTLKAAEADCYSLTIERGNAQEAHTALCAALSGLETEWRERDQRPLETGFTMATTRCADELAAVLALHGGKE